MKQTFISLFSIFFLSNVVSAQPSGKNAPEGHPKAHSKRFDSKMKHPSKSHDRVTRQSNDWSDWRWDGDRPVGASQSLNDFGDTKKYEGAEVFKSNLGADAVTVVNFDRGSSRLSSQEMTSVDQMINQFKQSQIPIDEIKVFVWPEDKQAISQGKRPERGERKIASDRLKQIKRHIQRDLGIRDVETFNVAQYGHQFQNLAMSPGTRIRSFAIDSKLPRQVSLSERVNELLTDSPGQALVLIYKQQ